jgi:coenzyme F420-reducing hydrogenase alpha subunit
MVKALARVEGEGGMVVRVRDGAVQDVELSIYEPPRFFEAFLRGRRFTETPDITARICGICPVAYQMSSCLAMEDIRPVTVDGTIADLRRLLYCGEWIESHTLHIYLLHAPDFLGYAGAVEMAKDHRELVEQGLRLKRAGNDILALLGGRSVHPINVRVGGFYSAPSRQDLGKLRETLLSARDDALETVEWCAQLEFPDFSQEYTFLALQHPDIYPIMEGRIGVNDGSSFDVQSFDDHVVEEHVAHSNALHARLADGRSYMAGPLARYALNRPRLSEIASAAASEAGLGEVCNNPFQSIVVRAVETLYAVDEAIRIIEHYEVPDVSFVEVEPCAGVGYGATEAPRGLLYHRYQIDDEGIIEDARIVPPTSQNQVRIEEDLRSFVEPRLDLPNDELTWLCEQAIRNYDPCISCATHFLELSVVRE